MEFTRTSDLNGILKNLFYSQNSKYYEKQIFYNVSSTYTSYGVSSAPFDYGSSKYWVAQDTDKPAFISFCFVNGYAKLYGYDLKTSTGQCFPVKWYFSGSNNQRKWYNNKTYEVTYSSGQTKYHQWNYGPYKCFKIECAKNTQNSNQAFDISKIEIYGIYYPNSFINYRCTSNGRKSQYHLYQMIFLLSS